MRASLKAFALAAVDLKDLNPRMGISFQATELGRENTINPTAVGMPQRPTITEITEFTGGN